MKYAIRRYIGAMPTGWLIGIQGPVLFDNRQDAEDIAMRCNRTKIASEDPKVRYEAQLYTAEDQ